MSIRQVQSLLYAVLLFSSYGFVSFSTVEEAMQFVGSGEEIILDDHVLSINYALRGA